MKSSFVKMWVANLNVFLSLPVAFIVAWCFGGVVFGLSSLLVVSVFAISGVFTVYLSVLMLGIAGIWYLRYFGSAGLSLAMMLVWICSFGLCFCTTLILCVGIISPSFVGAEDGLLCSMFGALYFGVSANNAVRAAIGR